MSNNCGDPSSTLIKTDTPSHLSFNVSIGCMYAIRCGLTNSVRCTRHNTVVDSSSTDSALLHSGTVWNPERLKLDKSPTVDANDAPNAPQFVMLDALLTLVEPLQHGDEVTRRAFCYAQGTSSRRGATCQARAGCYDGEAPHLMRRIVF